jgi:hypothetical protein
VEQGARPEERQLLAAHVRRGSDEAEGLALFGPVQGDVALQETAEYEMRRLAAVEDCQGDVVPILTAMTLARI